MRSTARAQLERLIAEKGVDGVLLLLKGTPGDVPGKAAGGDARIPFGSPAYPPCRCPQHRAGEGRPDASVRLSGKDVPQPHPPRSAGELSTNAAEEPINP